MPLFREQGDGDGETRHIASAVGKSSALLGHSPSTSRSASMRCHGKGS